MYLGSTVSIGCVVKDVDKKNRDTNDHHVVLFDPEGAWIKETKTPKHVSKGKYRVDFLIPLKGKPGTWTISWTTWVDGRIGYNEVKFKVQPRTVKKAKLEKLVMKIFLEDEFDQDSELLSIERDFMAPIEIDEHLLLASLHMDDLPHQFVMQDHWRGKGVHIDHRWERIKGGDILDGMTIAHMKPGIAKKSIDTVAKALEMLKHNEYYKITNEPTAKKMFAEEKKPEPREWLHVRGVVERGEVGATRYEYGVFVFRDKGVQYYGAQKPFFKEFFLYGNKYTGRWVYRQIERRKPVGARAAFLWQFGKPLDQSPYVLSRRAVNDEWVPPYNVSCLPPEIKKKVPKEFQYWLHKDKKKRLEVRNSLREAIKRKEVKIELEKRLPFSLQHHWWKRFAKGRPVVVIRTGPSAEHWDIRIKEAPPPKPLIHFLCTKNPLVVDSLGVIERPCPDHEWLFKGHPKPVYLPPGTPGNPTKATAAFIEVIDKGTVVIFEKTDMFIKLKFFGDKLKGLWTLKREALKAPYWRMSRSALPKPK